MRWREEVDGSIKRDDAFSNLDQVIAKLQTVLAEAALTKYQIDRLTLQLHTLQVSGNVHVGLCSIIAEKERRVEATIKYDVLNQKLLDVQEQANIKLEGMLSPVLIAEVVAKEVTGVDPRSSEDLATTPEMKTGEE